MVSVMQAFWAAFVFPLLVSVVFLILVERLGIVVRTPASCLTGRGFESQPRDRILMVFLSPFIKMFG